MKPKKMTVREMDRVNNLIDHSTRIDRLNLSQRERALAYLRFIVERNASEDLKVYANRFDDLVRHAQKSETLIKIRECALAVRRENGS